MSSAWGAMVDGCFVLGECELLRYSARDEAMVDWGWWRTRRGGDGSGDGVYY